MDASELKSMNVSELKEKYCKDPIKCPSQIGASFNKHPPLMMKKFNKHSPPQKSASPLFPVKGALIQTWNNY